MIEKVRAVVRKPEKRNVALLVGGMGALMVGARAPALALFGTGFRGLEREWRRKRNFDGTWRERWDRAARFYEATHKDPTNRALHIVGIPMIVGGAAGLLAFRPLGLTGPLWAASAGSFAVGWGLNLVGHAVYEKNAPAFAEDPLSFVAGPVWDAQQVARAVLGGREGEEALQAAAK